MKWKPATGCRLIEDGTDWWACGDQGNERAA